MVGLALLWARRNWRLVAIGLAVAVWLGMIAAGAWFLSSQAEKRLAAEARAAVAEGQVADLTATALADAARIAALTTRLSAEQELARLRLEAERERAEAANTRRRQIQGEVNDLRNRLDSVPECNCGIGADLTDSLRQHRAERLANLRPRNP